MTHHWQTLCAIDFDKWAVATYRANFPDVDVRQGPVSDFIASLPEADVVTGGPPCQPHSLSGNRKASADVRDGGPDFVAAVAKVKPRHFLMENVPGLVSSEGGRYWQRLYASMEDAGYVVAYRIQDAVSFGVPQFRSRLWVWGIRKDLYTNGIRHQWPKRTHTWPPPLKDPDLFGLSAALHYLPAVTVGESLGLDGTLHRKRGKGMLERAGDRRDHPTTEPSPAITSAFALGGGGGLFIQSHADPAQTVDRPAPTLRSGGAGHDGCCLRLEAHAEFVGIRRAAGPNSQQAKYGHTYTAEEPAPTVNAMGKGGSDGLEAVIAYRWSDAMLAKHPPALPALPALPAPTVMAKWLKGSAEGLLAAGPWKHKGELWVRRLSPLECARLQSVPDSFAWPEGMTKTAAYRIVGNGWACAHAAKFSRALAAADPDARTVVDLFCGGGLGACGWHGRHWTYTEREAVAALLSLPPHRSPA